MNILRPAYLLALLIGIQGANAADNLKFTGTIVASGCNVDMSSANQDVTIGQFSPSDFPTVGTTTEAVKFNITLKECSEDIIGSKILFSGTSDSNDHTLLALSDTGKGSEGKMATGIGVQILDANQNPISINNTDSDVYPLVEGDNTLDFYLRYKSTKTDVTVGDATAVMYFDVKYQ
ncbi:TPA: fimbrial protein [Enterobacter asburiae]|uniref:fimbrial protein n=1 Tax=Enterobacter asburiae TaxID=61645 RepID=UPI001F332303|nr:fimbrial protein [Enterobacter asburiae]MCF1340952.1 fimbrial protein [Enterobacter asburiae]MCM6996792.1 fimbrial protein [Enterobacter asburiae]MCQ4339330.1 fimbrial protein [Enterobacter asburiae]HDC4532621.1 fimbrial protein [Enterobacter asburiae]HDC4561751.1 fimbrial protein [Enterobacter asburiae]